MHSHAQCFGHEMENVHASDFWDHMQGLYLEHVLPPQIHSKNPSWGWGQGLCDRLCDPEQQFCSCFPITGTGDGKIPTAEVGQRQKGKITDKNFEKNNHQRL